MPSQRANKTKARNQPKRARKQEILGIQKPRKDTEGAESEDKEDDVQVQSCRYSELSLEERQIVIPYAQVSATPHMLSIEEVPRAYNNLNKRYPLNFTKPHIGSIMAASLNHFTCTNDISGRFKFAFWPMHKYSFPPYGVLIFASKRFDLACQKAWQDLSFSDRIQSTYISSIFHWGAPQTSVLSIQFLRGLVDGALVRLETVMSNNDFENRKGYALMDIDNELFFGPFDYILAQDGPWETFSDKQQREPDDRHVFARFTLETKTDAAKRWFQRWRLLSPQSMIGTLQQDFRYDIAVSRWGDIYEQLMSAYRPIDYNYCTHDPIPPKFVCSFKGCGREFTEKGNMIKHAHTHDPGNIPPKFVCSFEGCGREFATKSNITRHAHTHDPIPPKFVCSFKGCGKEFTEKGNMTRHAHTHDPIPPKFVCPFEGCGQEFTEKGNMTRHAHTHDPIPPKFVCSFKGCGKEFTEKGNMTRHAHTHDPAPPKFVCPFEGCGQEFTRKGNMTKHARTHD